MAIKCLMLETKESKKFFTKIGNKDCLTEYCRTFGTKMLVVKAELKRNQVLDLNKLISALCDKNYENKKVNFEVLRRI